ncbi:MAG: hypothetical protein ACJAQT_000488 [Akkermansiaceae bacterium]|jgi:hypothetical protein
MNAQVVVGGNSLGREEGLEFFWIWFHGRVTCRGKEPLLRAVGLALCPGRSGQWLISVDATVLVAKFWYGFDYFEKHSGGFACPLQKAGEEEFTELAGGDSSDSL